MASDEQKTQRMEQAQQCFNGAFASVLTTVATAMSMLRTSEYSQRMPSLRNAAPATAKRIFGPSAKELANVKAAMVGEAGVWGPKISLSGSCKVSLHGDTMLIMQESRDPEKEPQQEAIEITGAEVECEGAQVSLIRNSVIVLRLSLDDERAAGLWATKLAVAGGNAESISKLFSIQRRRIETLEVHTEEAAINNEQVERCLNFLSREYVQMRYEVRTSGPANSGLRALASPDMQQEHEVGGPLVESVEEELLEDGVGMRHQSEPEKEPLDAPSLKEAATGEAGNKNGYPSLLAPNGQFGPTPRNTAKSAEKAAPKASRQLGRVLAELPDKSPSCSPVPDRDDRRRVRASLPTASMQSPVLNRPVSSQPDRRSVRTGANMHASPNSR